MLCEPCKANNTERPSSFFCYTCDYGICVPCEQKMRGTCKMCRTKVYEIVRPRVEAPRGTSVGTQTEPEESINPNVIIERTDLMLGRRMWEGHLGHELDFMRKTEESSVLKSIKNFVRGPSTSHEPTPW